MSKEESKEITHDPEVVWKMIDRVRTTMFITHTRSGLDGRPLTAFGDQEAGRIFFMVPADGDVASDVEAEGRVFLSLADKGKTDFATIDGDAVVTNDRAKIRELWNPWAQAFFEGPDDPRIRIIEVSPGHARYWDSPNAVVTTLAMLGGLVSGKRPDVGKQGETQM